MNLFELFVKIGVNDQASKNISKISEKLGNGLKTAAKVGTAAVTAAATAITALTTLAVNEFAEYEQLVGGVETLYGAKYKTIEEYIEGTGAAAEHAEHTFAEYQKRQQDVLNNAANAYKTAGMSMNEYMNTVNSFAASLTNSLGEYEWMAASYADMIVTDMADNANKMGTSMEMIQNAYQGFAKQNYTMLDNLKLGYGGTKTEMERLMRDAEEMAGYIEGSLKIESFADVAEAIHIVQEEMGITGTTAREAAETISGSIATMKSAWSNFIVSLASETGNYKEQIDILIESVGTVASNVYPVVERVFYSLGEVVTKELPQIIGKIPTLLSQNLPKVVKLGTDLINAWVQGIGQNSEAIVESAAMAVSTLIETIMSSLPDILTTGSEISMAIIDGISENADEWIESAITAIELYIETFVGLLPEVIKLGIQLIVSLINGIAKAIPDLIPAILDAVDQIIETLTDPNTLDMIIEAAFTLMDSLVGGLIEAIPRLIDGAIKLIEGLVDYLLDPDNLKKIVDGAVSLVIELATGLAKNIPELIAGVAGLVGNIISAIFETDWVQVGWDIIAGVADGVWSAVTEMFTGLGNAIAAAFGGSGRSFVEFVEDVTTRGGRSSGKFQGEWSGSAAENNAYINFPQPQPATDFTFTFEAGDEFSNFIVDNLTVTTRERGYTR